MSLGQIWPSRQSVSVKYRLAAADVFWHQRTAATISTTRFLVQIILVMIVVNGKVEIFQRSLMLSKTGIV